MYAIRSYYGLGSSNTRGAVLHRRSAAWLTSAENVVGICRNIKSRFSRITSYNVCYTKLLRLAEHAPAFRTAVEKLLRLPSQLPCRISTDGRQCPAGRKIRHNAWSGIHPGMLEKALAHGMVLLESERSGILKEIDTLYAREEIYKKERVDMQNTINSLGLKIAALEEQNLKIAALEKQNMDQEARITDLLHQITVLEKIDTRNNFV